MECPYCGTANDPSSKFCSSCGKPLRGQSPQVSSAADESAYSPRTVVGIQTARLLISLLGLWLLKVVLTGLPFVEELHIPELGVSIPSIISMLIYLVIVIALVSYASFLSRLWPQAFPGYPQAVSVLVAAVYLIVLAVAYNGSKPIIRAITTDPQLMMIWQIVLVAIALFISLRASVIVYRFLPAWLMTARRGILAVPPGSVPREGGQD